MCSVGNTRVDELFHSAETHSYNAAELPRPEQTSKLNRCRECYILLETSYRNCTNEVLYYFTKYKSLCNS